MSKSREASKVSVWRLDLMTRIENDGRENKEQHKAIYDILDSLRAALKEMLECLNGNGKPGMKTKVAVLQAQINILKWFMAACITGVIVPLILKYGFHVG